MAQEEDKNVRHTCVRTLEKLSGKKLGNNERAWIAYSDELLRQQDAMLIIAHRKAVK